MGAQTPVPDPPPPEDMPFEEFKFKRLQLIQQVRVIQGYHCRPVAHIHFRFTHREILPWRRQENLDHWADRYERVQARKSLCFNAVARRKFERLPNWLVAAFDRIHRCEGSWKDTGDPYWGGLQMNRGFMYFYGRDAIRWYDGFAHKWPRYVQILVASRAYYGYHGEGARFFSPWPTCQREV